MRHFLDVVLVDLIENTTLLPILCKRVWQMPLAFKEGVQIRTQIGEYISLIVFQFHFYLSS